MWECDALMQTQFRAFLPPVEDRRYQGSQTPAQNDVLTTLLPLTVDMLGAQPSLWDPGGLSFPWDPGGHFPFDRGKMDEPRLILGVRIRTVAWTLNRVARPCGKSPLEVFTDGKAVPNFKHVQPPGVLAYWHVDKDHRTDRKLGNAAAVGVYIGPGQAFGHRGHVVYTASNSLHIVARAVADVDSKPFQLGLLRELLKKSTKVTGVFD